jgi:calmodulin
LEAFRIFDRDNSGAISRHELQQVAAALELKVNDGNELDELIKKMDTDGDGQISFSEFLR